MKEFISRIGKNTLEDLTAVICNLSGYSDSTIDYPSFSKAKKDDGVPAEFFYSVTNGSVNFSELSAIHMYVQQEAIFEEIGELMLGIGIVEMQHYGKLNEFVCKLGGKITQTFKTTAVEAGKDIPDALKIAISGEQATIDEYERIVNKVSRVGESKTAEIALQLLNKLIADERKHIELLTEKLKEYEQPE